MHFHKFLKHQNVSQFSSKQMMVRNMLTKVFNDFLNNNKVKKCSPYTDKGAVFAERFNWTIRYLLKKPVFEKVKSGRLSELPSIIKKYIDTIHNSTKVTPNQASKKQMKKNLQDWKVRQHPKFKLGHFVRTADIKRVFSKGVLVSNCSYKLYTITEVIHNTIPSYRINYLQIYWNTIISY